MHIAVLQFDLLIHGAQSLKDKRRVVRSVKDRLHREHLVSVAEVRHLEDHARAGMALAAVNPDARYLQGVIDSITEKLRKLPDASLGACERDLISGQQLPGNDRADDGSPLWTPDEARQPEPPVSQQREVHP